ncbi:MAG: ParA family protein [Hyphomicrobiales bacterium]|nr:ParA family protein [Hyphomicrobiales bacterium]
MLTFHPVGGGEAPGKDDPQAQGNDRGLRVIVFSSQKGGSGKTTLCGHLAVQAELAGCGPVALIDTDPQGSLAAWWNARASETPLFMKAQVDYLHEDLDQLERSGVNLVFIDTPPAVTDTIRQIVAFADLVVIPTKPSPHDLRAVGATLDIVDSQMKQLVFVVNDAMPRARMTSDTAIALSQHGTVAPVCVSHRVVYATSMIHGMTVVETDPGSPPALEIADLWNYVYSRVDKPVSRGTMGTGVFQKRAAFGRRRPSQEAVA